MLAGGIANKGMKNVSEKKMRTGEKKGGRERGIRGSGGSQEVGVLRLTPLHSISIIHALRLA